MRALSDFQLGYYGCRNALDLATVDWVFFGLHGLVLCLWGCYAAKRLRKELWLKHSGAVWKEYDTMGVLNALLQILRMAHHANLARTVSLDSLGLSGPQLADQVMELVRINVLLEWVYVGLGTSAMHLFILVFVKAATGGSLYSLVEACGLSCGGEELVNAIGLLHWLTITGLSFLLAFYSIQSDSSLGRFFFWRRGLYVTYTIMSCLTPMILTYFGNRVLAMYKRRNELGDGIQNIMVTTAHGSQSEDVEKASRSTKRPSLAPTVNLQSIA
ncbi:hypothetical protein HDU91_003550, partial [Kappamyces sp. JEL0680]